MCSRSLASRVLRPDRGSARPDPVHEPQHVAQIVLDGVENNEFLVLPHPEVLDMYRMKGSDYQRWISGMQRYQTTLTNQHKE